MRHVVTYINGAEDWEMLYVDGKQELVGHQLYPNEILRLLCRLENPFDLVIFSWIGEDETEAWEKVFSNGCSDIKEIMEYLIGPEFEKCLGRKEWD